MYEHLLVPVDDSELSDKAIEHSVGLAKLLGASITGFTVEPPLPPMMMEQVAVAYTAATIQDHQTSCEAHARRVLQRFADRAVEAGVPFDGQFMVSESVPQAIVDIAERQKCDLIVMGSHGRHGFDAIIHGSVAKGVLSNSQLPLLIIH